MNLILPFVAGVCQEEGHYDNIKQIMILRLLLDKINGSRQQNSLTI